MNLLIFVMALLMVLASITYSSLHTFFRNEVQSFEWQDRIRVVAYSKYNDSLRFCPITSKSITKTSKAIPVDAETEQEKKTPSAPKETGRGTLPAQFLLNASYRKIHENEFPQFQELFKTLIRILYSDQPFYKRMQEERPNFLDEMIREIVDISERGKHPISKLDDLMFEKWGDPDLKHAFSYMLKATPIYRRPKREFIEWGNLDQEENESSYPIDGIYSLNFFMHSNNKDKIRLWLAPKVVLYALYKDFELVDLLVQDRYEQYKALNRGLYEKQQIQKHMEENYKGKSPFDSFIDFTVTKTLPPK